MTSVLFIVHGRLRNSESWKRIWRQLSTCNEWGATVYFSEYQGHAAHLVKEKIGDGSYAALIACGGDGTLHDCLNGLMEAKANVPMGILALGTGNDFVKSIGLSGTWDEVHLALQAHQTMSCDVMRLETSHSVKYGLNVADIGIGGEIVQRLSEDSRWMGSFLTYQKNIIKAFFRFKPRPATYCLDGKSKQSDRLFLLAICNASWFGSGLCIDPDAKVNDGILNVVLVNDISLVDYIRQLPSLRKGTRLKHPAVSYQSAQLITIDGAGWPIDCDGEFIGYSPLKVELMRDAVNILKPRMC